MSEGDMSPEMRDYYNQTIEAHRTSGGFERAAGLAESLNVDLPKGAEQMALTPEAAMDWARRTLRVEKKFKEAAGGDLEAVSDEKLKEITLDPIDVQAARLGFVQFYSRFMVEASIAKNPDATPEQISLFRGGGRSMETWMAENVYKEPDGDDDLDKALKHLETLNAASLVAQPMEGVSRSGALLVFADRADKAKS